MSHCRGTSSLSPTRVCRGFSLVEVAIVLTIFGALIGGIAILIGTATNNQRMNRLSQQVMSILENTRNYASKVDKSNFYLVATADFSALGLLPADVSSNGGNFNHIMGQPLVLCAAANAKGGLACPDGVSIGLDNIDSSACINILSKIGGNFENIGLVSYQVNSAAGVPATAANLALTKIADATVCSATQNNGDPGVDLRLTFSN